MIFTHLGCKSFACSIVRRNLSLRPVSGLIFLIAQRDAYLSDTMTYESSHRQSLLRSCESYLMAAPICCVLGSTYRDRLIMFS